MSRRREQVLWVANETRPVTLEGLLDAYDEWAADNEEGAIAVGINVDVARDLARRLHQLEHGHDT